MDLSQYTVSGSMIVCILLSMILCIGLPVVLTIGWMRRTGARIKAALLGAVTFLIFAMLLEPILHNAVLAAIGNDRFMALPFYAVYGGLAAGIFEEMGRYLVMRFLMKGRIRKEEAVLFGIGHGGLESILLTGGTAIGNLVIAFLLNTGQGGLLLTGVPQELHQQVFDQISPLWTSAPPMMLLPALERIFAIAFHICASYLVYRAVRDRKFSLCLLAVLLHAMMDGIMVAILKTTGSMLLTEAFIAAFAVLFAIVTIRMYRGESRACEDGSPEGKEEIMTEQNRPVPSWAGEMPEGAFISCAPTYEAGKYFSLYEKGEYLDAAGMSLKYFYHDPDRDAVVKRRLPLLVFLHGTGNALVGDLCINYTGAEYYASEARQKSMGGAQILIPVANEYTGEDGRTAGYWSPEYLEPVHALIMDFIRDRRERTGPVFLFGNSSGATFVMRLMDTFMDDFDVVVPMGSADLPEDAVLDEYDRKGKYLFFAFGRRDEFHDYRQEVLPRVPRLEKMKHCFLFTPEWVCNGDKGIASINFGFEMGQHCIVNSMQANLMYDDGTPMDERLPDGMTGWIAQTVRELADRDGEPDTAV